MASSLLDATMTPFPAAKPLALTTKAGKSALQQNWQTDYSFIHLKHLYSTSSMGATHNCQSEVQTQWARHIVAKWKSEL